MTVLFHKGSEEVFRMVQSVSLSQIADRIIVIIVSGESWLLLGFFNDRFLSFVAFAPGVDLLYLPAALRIALIMTFGIWGAIGIACFDPILFLNEFGPYHPTNVAITALTVAFTPWLTITACRAFMGLNSSLADLRLKHLPVIALATAVTTPVALQLESVLRGSADPMRFFPNLLAMIFGDFLACALVLITIRVAFFFGRHAYSRGNPEHRDQGVRV